MDDLICLALLGDREAQNECTDQGVALPCPFCGTELKKCASTKYYFTYSMVETQYNHPKNGCIYSDHSVCLKNLSEWNTRQKPPFKECKTCRYYGDEDKHPYGGACSWWRGLVDPDDFCSYYETKEAGDEK